MRAADLLDFSRAAVDGSHVRAMKGGAKTGPSPVDRPVKGSPTCSPVVRSHTHTRTARSSPKATATGLPKPLQDVVFAPP
ncbi:MAG: family transposase [Pseudonocardia sp.]|nr:family transposase [Pseudonocardia sp.]